MSRRLAMLWSGLWSGLLVVFAVFADDDDPRRWLDDMNRAFSDLSYDGIFSYYSGQELATLRIVHMVIDGEQRERLVHLNGAPREILRHGEEVVCVVEPGDALLALGETIPVGPFAGAFIRSYNRISDYYGLSFFGDDRVADRPAVRLSIKPLDAHRYGYRLWLDRETRLLLRSELIDVEGDRLEIFQFNQISLGDRVDPEALEPETRDGAQVSHLTLATKQAQPLEKQALAWEPGWLPDGFAMMVADVRPTPDSTRTVSRMMYSDGLAAFSLFIEDLPETEAVSMESRNGATVAVSHRVRQADVGSSDVASADTEAASAELAHLVTVVGEIPIETAHRIARSIRPLGTD